MWSRKKNSLRRVGSIFEIQNCNADNSINETYLCGFNIVITSSVQNVKLTSVNYTESIMTNFVNRITINKTPDKFIS